MTHVPAGASASAPRAAEPGPPFVSVVIEGYNESRELGSVDASLAALARQDCPLDRIEVILVGSGEQVRHRAARAADPRPFQRIVLVDAGDAKYLEMKNEGARHAAGAIVACTDSDVEVGPSWLRSIVEAIEAGADVSVGLSLFQGPPPRGPHAATRLAAASITWGWTVGRSRGDAPPLARGFMDHNVALRASVFADHRYRTEFGRTLGAPLLFRALTNAGARIVLQPGQLAVHSFSWRYWLIGLHFRYGYEVYTLRREDRQYPNQWIARTRLLEPVVSMAWHVLLDLPRWFRFSRLVGVHPARRLLLFPLLVSLSLVARGSEMVGIFWTIFAPAAMRRWAESV